MRLPVIRAGIAGQGKVYDQEHSVAQGYIVVAILVARAGGILNYGLPVNKAYQIFAHLGFRRGIQLIAVQRVRRDQPLCAGCKRVRSAVVQEGFGCNSDGQRPFCDPQDCHVRRGAFDVVCAGYTHRKRTYHHIVGRRQFVSGCERCPVDSIGRVFQRVGANRIGIEREAVQIAVIQAIVCGQINAQPGKLPDRQRADLIIKRVVAKGSAGNRLRVFAPKRVLPGFGLRRARQSNRHIIGSDQAGIAGQRAVRTGSRFFRGIGVYRVRQPVIFQRLISRRDGHQALRDRKRSIRCGGIGIVGAGRADLQRIGAGVCKRRQIAFAGKLYPVYTVGAVLQLRRGRDRFAKRVGKSVRQRIVGGIMVRQRYRQIIRRVNGNGTRVMDEVVVIDVAHIQADRIKPGDFVVACGGAVVALQRNCYSIAAKEADADRASYNMFVSIIEEGVAVGGNRNIEFVYGNCRGSRIEQQAAGRIRNLHSYAVFRHVHILGVRIAVRFKRTRREQVQFLIGEGEPCSIGQVDGLGAYCETCGHHDAMRQ